MQHLTDNVTENPTEKVLIIEPVNGLCNRLRAMASGWILSLHLNRTFKVMWNASPEIGCASFTDLFQNEGLLINEDELPDKCSVYTAGILTEVSLIPKVCEDSSDVIVLKQTGGNYMPPGVSVNKFNTLKSQWYNTLMPVDDVLNRVNSFCEEVNLSECLGVHVRRTDRKNLTPKTELFGLAIKRKLTDGLTRVFLCTDDPTEVKKIEQASRCTVVVYPKKRFDRDSVESVKVALVEWLLLSKCGNVIYSHGSSFGYEACVCGKMSDAFELRSKREKSDNEKRNLPELKF